MSYFFDLQMFRYKFRISFHPKISLTKEVHRDGRGSPRPLSQDHEFSVEEVPRTFSLFSGIRTDDLMTHHYHANVIGSICSSRTTELIYRQLRDQLDTDEDVNESITGIMEGPGNARNGQTLIAQIESHYLDFQRLKRQRFFEEVRDCFDRVQAGGHDLEYSEFYATKTALYSCLKKAEVQMRETLANRTCYPFLLYCSAK